MKKILCSVMDGRFIKEYEMTYNEEDLEEFFQELYYTNIEPATHEINNSYRVQKQIWQAEQFDKLNTLRNENDIKQYIYDLHKSSLLDLTKLDILMKSNGAMRNNQVRSIFRKFLNLYTYSEISCHDSRELPIIIRKMYEFREEYNIPKVNPHIIDKNTSALEDIGFSIERKIIEQKAEQKLKQKVMCK